MTPQQCGAARALIGLSRPQLSILASVGQNTVLNFEVGNHQATRTTVSKIRRAFETLSIRFIDDRDGIGVQRSRKGLAPKMDREAPEASAPTDNPDQHPAIPGALIDIGSAEAAGRIGHPDITPEQSRAARAFLDLSQVEAACRAGVGLSLLVSFENGVRAPRRTNAAKIRRMYEECGIAFTWISGAPAVHAMTRAAPALHVP